MIKTSRNSMPQCIDCQDEHYILHGCCDGRECGCMAKPVLITNCVKCNPAGDKTMGEYVASWSSYIEYRHRETEL